MFQEVMKGPKTLGDEQVVVVIGSGGCCGWTSGK